MIDIEKCEFEDYFHDGFGNHEYYFICPLYFPEGLFEKTKEQYEEEYAGDITQMAIHLEVDGETNEVTALRISPTVETDVQLSDVDWENLRYDIDVNDEIVDALRKEGEAGKKVMYAL